MIYTGHEYRTSHVVSTKFAIIVAFLSLYYVTKKHPITGSIIVTALRLKALSNLFHDVSSASFTGNLPYIFVERFIRWHTSHLVTSLWKDSIIPERYKC